MAIYKFNEILNDLVDYFLLADTQLLLDYKQQHQLPDDLLTEFTTEETGDRVVQQGIMIPLARVNNYPYTIIFNLSGTPVLEQDGNDLQLRKDGYILRVQHGRIYLFTMPYLRRFTSESPLNIARLQRATIELENGWYEVSVLGGQLKEGEDLEPCFEFLLNWVEEQPEYKGDISGSFSIDADQY
ncbi:hypothetical protein [uncultured Chitinophaga sp.]|uniref:hypothetical protein n=1 Tax=uncultured Chitinophaga sp. TaxID=339340 RepID=UPI0025CDC16F|nr:hypothetical protein [uncultured Chitinophaga sp.]